MRVNDFFVGLFFFLLGLGIVWQSQGLASAANIQFGASFFPTLIGIAMTLMGGVLMLTEARTLRSGNLGVRPDWSKDAGSMLRTFSPLLGIAFYLVAAPLLGFLATSALIMLFMLLVLRVGFIASLVVSVVVALLFTLLFASILRVPLPWGPLEGISGWFLW